MKKYNITVSPDFKPDKIAGWYIFNTYLQQAADISLHLNLYDGFEQQRKASFLSSLDTLITTATQELETLKTHKKGLMQQLFPVLDETPI